MCQSKIRHMPSLPVTISRLELEVVAGVARFDGNNSVANSIDRFLMQSTDEVTSCCEPTMPEMVWWGAMYYHWSCPNYLYQRSSLVFPQAPEPHVLRSGA
ncbi:MAG: hypothetical protein AAB360_03475 [Patescibacteria group bacterium]